MPNRYAFDVWFSDGNDRQCIGVLGVEGDDLESAGWKALDKAVETYGKDGVEWDMPYADPCAITDIHGDCDHHTEDEDCNEDCDDCYFPNSIAVEPCDDPEEDYYHHSRCTLASLFEGEKND